MVIPHCLLTLSRLKGDCARGLMKITLWKGKGNRGRCMAVCVILFMAKEEVNDGSGFF